MAEATRETACDMIAFTLDVIHQDCGHDPKFRISIEPTVVSNKYVIQFETADGEAMQLSYILRAYEPMTIPSETLASIALILS